MAKGYDMKCYELAIHFTQDIENVTPDQLGIIRSDLAIAIQQAVEDHLFMLDSPSTRVSGK